MHIPSIIYTLHFDLVKIAKKIVPGQSVSRPLSVHSSIGSCERRSLCISCSSCCWFWPVWSRFLKTTTAAPFPTILPVLSTPCYATPTVLLPHESLVNCSHHPLMEPFSWLRRAVEHHFCPSNIFNGCIYIIDFILFIPLWEPWYYWDIFLLLLMLSWMWSKKKSLFLSQCCKEVNHCMSLKLFFCVCVRNIFRFKHIMHWLKIIRVCNWKGWSFHPQFVMTWWVAAILGLWGLIFQFWYDLNQLYLQSPKQK